MKYICLNTTFNRALLGGDTEFGQTRANVCPPQQAALFISQMTPEADKLKQAEYDAGKS